MIANFKPQIQRYILKRVIATAALCGLVLFGCTTPAKYREVTAGMTPEQVLAILGEPGSKKRVSKPASADDYFGPKPSTEYLALPVGARIEIWSYQYFRETWSYVFTLEGSTARVVDTIYYHPDIKY
jgi:hypothetical protein